MYRIQELSDNRASFDKTVLAGIDFVGNKVVETIKQRVQQSVGHSQHLKKY